MTANELFAWMETMNPSPYTTEQKLLWLNELEGNLWKEVLLQPAALWKPRKDTELERPLLLPEGNTMLYAMYLWAMMDFARGEHGNYANSMALYNDHLAQLQCWYAENYAPAMHPAVWTEWAVCTYDGTGEPRAVMALPHGCAVLGAEWRVTEEGTLEDVRLGTETDTELYIPQSAIDPAARGAGRCVGFREPGEPAVFAHGEGTGTVKFRLLLQSALCRPMKAPGAAPVWDDPAVGTVVAGEKGEPGPAGADGKSAYAYAVDGGYTGSEAEFAAKLAAETPGIHIGAEAPEDDSLLWVDTDEEAEEEETATVPPDWNAAEGEPGHVLNRPFYEGMAELVNGTATDIGDGALGIATDVAGFVVGKTYTVTYNGVDYTCTPFEFDTGTGGGLLTFLGNGTNLGLEDTGEPFMMAIMDGMLVCMDMNGANEATIRIVGNVVVPIPQKYLPDVAKSYTIEVTDEEWATLSDGIVTMSQTYDDFIDILYSGGDIRVRVDVTSGKYVMPAVCTAVSAVWASAEQTQAANRLLIRCTVFNGTTFEDDMSFMFDGTKYPPGFTA